MALDETTKRLRETPGLETGLSSEDHDHLRLWLRIMTVHKLTSAEVRKRLPFANKRDWYCRRITARASCVGAWMNWPLCARRARMHGFV